MELCILARRRAASTFAPSLFSLSFVVCSFVGEALSSPSWQQQAAAVLTQHICRHRHRSAWPFAALDLFPSRLKLVSAASNPTDQPPNPWTATTCIHPSVVLVVKCLKGKNSWRYTEENVHRREIKQYLKAVGSNPLHCCGLKSNSSHSSNT